MPLSDGYAVLQGDLETYFRDDPDAYGKWYHVNLRVRANGILFECAVDVDSKASDVGVEWRLIPIRQEDVQPLLDLGEGLHPLASNASSGAIDYIRSPMFELKLGCLFVRMPSPLIRLLIRTANLYLNTWTTGNYAEASTAFESILESGSRCLVWGEPFTSGHGLHNIHQNQGDPIDSQWSAENGIWQDGGTLVQRPNGHWMAFLSKFSSQSYETDDAGHPLGV